MRYVPSVISLLLSVLSGEANGLYAAKHWNTLPSDDFWYPLVKPFTISELRAASFFLALAAVVLGIVGLRIGPRWIGTIAIVVALVALIRVVVLVA